MRKRKHRDKGVMQAQEAIVLPTCLTSTDIALCWIYLKGTSGFGPHLPDIYKYCLTLVSV